VQACRDQRQLFDIRDLEPKDHLHELSNDLEGYSPQEFGPLSDLINETWEIHCRPSESPLQMGRNEPPVKGVVKRVEKSAQGKLHDPFNFPAQVKSFLVGNPCNHRMD